jgi:hypothetical protein
VKRLIANGQIQEAVKLYEVKPDPFSATFLISHASKNVRDLSLCLSVYNTLKKTDKPDSFVFSALVHAYQHLGGEGSHIGSIWSDMLQYK